MEFEARGKHVRLPAEVRADDDGILVEGYAVVFNEETDIGGFFRERIESGAFSEAIGRDDVVFLINHDGLPLARTRSGTLTLSEDERGLKISTRLEDGDPDVARIVGKMRRGDLDKMSFAFWPDVQEWDDSGDVPLRTIKKASLHDVSIVTTPAYDGTEIGLRSLDAMRKQQAKETNRNAARLRRMRMNLRATGVTEG
jgi:HK97 family phage prohead protease